MKRALVPLANGTEEMEAVIIIDTLRRAQWNVVSAGVTGRLITASRGVTLTADSEWHGIDVDAFDILVLPGGREGARAFSSDSRVQGLIQRFVGRDKWVAAICAAPLALQAAGVLSGRRATCHPAVRAELTATGWQAERVVVDGHIVTSQGPGTALEFALTLIRLLDGPTTSDAVAQALVF